MVSGRRPASSLIKKTISRISSHQSLLLFQPRDRSLSLAMVAFGTMSPSRESSKSQLDMVSRRSSSATTVSCQRLLSLIRLESRTKVVLKTAWEASCSLLLTTLVVKKKISVSSSTLRTAALLQSQSLTPSSSTARLSPSSGQYPRSQT